MCATSKHVPAIPQKHRAAQHGGEQETHGCLANVGTLNERFNSAILAFVRLIVSLGLGCHLTRRCRAHELSTKVRARVCGDSLALALPSLVIQEEN